MSTGSQLAQNDLYMRFEATQDLIKKTTIYSNPLRCLIIYYNYQQSLKLYRKSASLSSTPLMD